MIDRFCRYWAGHYAIALLFTSLGQAALVPDWATRLHTAPNPSQVGAASAAVLLDETAIEIDPHGTTTTTHRLAIRILAEQGRGAAYSRIHYLQNNDKVRRAEAWLIRKGNPVKSKDRGDWIDMTAESGGTLFGEYRIKSISRSDDAVAGDVFVAETIVSRQALIPHNIYSWGWSYPVLEETLRITVPTGFSLTALMRGSNPPAGATSPDGRTSTWTLNDQPYVRRETMEPDFDRDTPTLYVTIDPPPGAAGFKPIVLQSWLDVAKWVNALNSGQCDSSPQLADTAQKLSSDCGDDVSKIRALGEYVQKLRYVAVNEGLGQGFGYKARKASQVFGQGYGDCKDKANLLVAMLREVGIEARTVAARSGDDRPIIPEFASPTQFDHAICAIFVSESVDLPSVVRTEKWGRVLFFDPTDPRTVVGDLPSALQGTLVHVDDLLSDALIELPRQPPQQGHVFVRKAVMQLTRDGTLSGVASVLGQGQAGAQMRRDLFEASTDEKLRAFTAELLGDTTRTSQLQKISREDNLTTGVCGVQFELTKKNFAQLLPNAMIMARLDVLSRGSLPTLPAPDRKFPIKIEALAFADDIELVLPEGLVAEEIPTGTSLVSEYGRYETSFESDGKKVALVRRVELNPQIVPASDYLKLKKFFSDIGKADRAAILLRKDN